MSRILTAGVAVVLTAIPASGDAAKSAAEIFEAASESVVVVNAMIAGDNILAQGSGVVISPGVVASNCHVLHGALGARIHHRGEVASALILHMDVERDVCTLVVTEELALPPASIGSTGSVRVGDPVYTIGAPRSLELSLSDGLVSSIRPVGGDLHGGLQITAPISPGSSGGGLFDQQGRLIGLTTLFLKESQQINFAIPVEWIEQLPARHRDPTTWGAAIKHGKTALNNLERWLKTEDSTYWCRRKLVVQELKPEIRERHPSHWATDFFMAYLMMDDEQCGAGRW